MCVPQNAIQCFEMCLLTYNKLLKFIVDDCATAFIVLTVYASKEKKNITKRKKEEERLFACLANGHCWPNISTASVFITIHYIWYSKREQNVKKKVRKKMNWIISFFSIKISLHKWIALVVLYFFVHFLLFVVFFICSWRLHRL